MNTDKQHAALKAAQAAAKTPAAQAKAQLAVLDYEAEAFGSTISAKLAADLRAAAKAHRAGMRDLAKKERESKARLAASQAFVTALLSR